MARIQPSRDSKDIIPVAMPAPRLDALVFDLGVQDRGYVKKRGVFDVDFVYCSPGRASPSASGSLTGVIIINCKKETHKQAASAKAPYSPRTNALAKRSAHRRHASYPWAGPTTSKARRYSR